MDNKLIDYMSSYCDGVNDYDIYNFALNNYVHNISSNFVNMIMSIMEKD